MDAARWHLMLTLSQALTLMLEVIVLYEHAATELLVTEAGLSSSAMPPVAANAATSAA